MNENSEKIDKCELCDKSGILICKGCSKARYCSEEHQNKHWKSHKDECRPFKIVDKKPVATRDISQSKLIFTEMPLVISPKVSFNNTSMIVNCVGCFEPVRIGGFTCPKCSWPACAPDCPGLINQKLHAIECPILSIGRAPASFSDQREYLDYYRYDALMPLKCLVLQKKNPKKWQELKSMASFEDKHKKEKKFEEAITYLEKYYIRLIKLAEQKSSKTLLSECDTTTLEKVYSIIETNSLTIELPGDRELSGLYAIASQLKHSCLPNCFYTFDNTSGFRLCLRAGRDIKADEDLSVMYTHILWGSQMRLDHLKSSKYILCKCKRCEDPTELGTYLSALKCFGSEELGPCNGIQLPTNPLSRKTEWSCNKCPIKITNDQVQFLTSQMSDEVDSINRNIEDLESLITKLSHFLHPNHYLLFNLKHSLIQLLGHQEDSKLTDSQISDKLEMCENLLKICDTLDPYTLRLSVYKSIILYEIQFSLVDLSQRKLTTKNSSSDNDKNMIATNLKKAQECLEKSKNVLHFEKDTKYGENLLNNIDLATKKLEGLIISNNIAI